MCAQSWPILYPDNLGVSVGTLSRHLSVLSPLYPVTSLFRHLSIPSPVGPFEPQVGPFESQDGPFESNMVQMGLRWATQAPNCPI